MSADENKAVVGRLWREAFGEAAVEEAGGLLDSDPGPQHALFANEEQGAGALETMSALLHRLLAEPRVTVKYEEADGEKVVVRWRIEGTAAEVTPCAGDGASISGVGTYLFSDGRVRQTRLYRFGPREPARHGPPEDVRERLLAGLPIGGPSADESARIICIICPSCCKR